MASVPANELRQVQVLLWDIIAARLPSAERDEVKSILGAALVEQNAGLFAEAGALAEILGDVRMRTDKSLAARRLYVNPSRSMLEDGLRNLLSAVGIHGQGGGGGGRPAKLLGTTTAHGSGRMGPGLAGESGRDGTGGAAAPSRMLDGRDRAAVDYVLGAAKLATLRPGTPRTPPSRPASARSVQSVASSRASDGAPTFDPAATVDAVAPHLGVYAVDAVAARLREALASERAALESDVEYLHECLEDEANAGAAAAVAPPSTSELAQLGAKLERHLALGGGGGVITPVSQPDSTGGGRPRSAVGRLRAAVAGAVDVPHGLVGHHVPPPRPMHAIRGGTGAKAGRT